MCKTQRRRRSKFLVVTRCFFLLLLFGGSGMAWTTNGFAFLFRRHTTTTAFFSSISSCTKRRATRTLSTVSVRSRSLYHYPSATSSWSFRRDQQQPRAFSIAAAVQPQQNNNDDDTKTNNLTRTMVRRMKVQELREQLKLRGELDINNHKKNRTQLVTMLLDQIAAAQNPAATSNSTLTKNNNDPDDDDKRKGEEEEQEETTTPSTENSTDQALDPSRTYILRPTCVCSSDDDDDNDKTTKASGSGIGLVLLDVESDCVVGTAQKYLPAPRSLFEASYTALVYALRCAVHCWCLPNLRVQIDQSLVIHQMVGIYPVEKESLKPLRQQALELKDAVGKNCSLELIPKSQNTQSQELALQALRSESSSQEFNAADDLDDDEDDAALLLSTDPMGKDYTGRPATTFPIQLDRMSIGDANDKNAEDDSKMAEQHEMTMTNDQKEAEAASDSSTTAIDPYRKYVLQFDGGSRGNPGQAGAGMAVFDDLGQEVWHGYKFLGLKISNNQAEYYSLVLGLQCALSLGIARIECHGDSELIIKQLNGAYKVKNEGLKKLYSAAKENIGKFAVCEFIHISRNENKRADELANVAMDEKSSFGFEEV